MIREISVRIENEPGRVYRVARELGGHGIDIAALSTADRETTGVLRLVVSDVATTRSALMELDLPASVTEVVAVTVSDRPGGLADALEPLEKEPLDVRYLYAFRRPGTDTAIVVLHTEENARAEELLRGAGFELLDEEALYG